jgi:hypothetical protein
LVHPWVHNSSWLAIVWDRDWHLQLGEEMITQWESDYSRCQEYETQRNKILSLWNQNGYWFKMVVVWLSYFDRKEFQILSC